MHQCTADSHVCILSRLMQENRDAASSEMKTLHDLLPELLAVKNETVATAR